MTQLQRSEHPVKRRRRPFCTGADLPIGKKTVGKQPIGFQRRIKRIDPIWCFGRVPTGFWEELENRRDFLLWVGHRLRFRRMEDWYRLRYQDFLDAGRSSVADLFWHGSPIEAVKECFPDYDWLEWLFGHVPANFSADPASMRRYMAWLGQRLGFRRMDDWYRVTTVDFQRNSGGGLLLSYHSSVSAQVMACFPDHDWKEWLFERAPNGFWHNRENCCRYLKWLGDRLGFVCLDDWYRVRCSDFWENHGVQLLNLHRRSATTVVLEFMPDHPWHEWKFRRVPPGFWDRSENLQRYVNWLGDQLGCRRMEDWLRVRNADFLAHYGGSLLERYRSHWTLLKKCFPHGNWPAPRRPQLRRRRRGQTMS